MLNFFTSIRVKFILCYVVLIAVILLLMNTYSLIIARDMIFTTKENAIENQVSIISTSLSGFEELTVENSKQVMDALDTRSMTRITIVNPKGDVIYDTFNSDSYADISFILENIGVVTSGNDIFSSEFSDGAFASHCFVPISHNSDYLGAIYVYEYDPQLGSLLVSLQQNLKNISLVISAVALLMMAIFLRPIMKRITRLLRAIQVVREGEYNYRIKTSGRDELTAMSAEFNSLTARLQQTEEMRRRFVSDASHELKTPLASIRLLSDSILENEQMRPDMVNEFVGDIRNEAERLARTTEKLLQLTRLDSEIKAELSSVDIRQVTLNALRMLKPLAEKHNIEINTQLETGCIILATDDDIHQIVFNLAENAIKYNKPNGQIFITLTHSDENVFFKVEDTGIGIPESDLGHIFDRFYRVDKARSREAGGSGLGLAIVNDTVLMHGGSISATNRPEGGTIFEVTFPLYKI